MDKKNTKPKGHKYHYLYIKCEQIGKKCKEKEEGERLYMNY